MRNMKSRGNLVPRVRCGIPEGAVCDLKTESTDGWRRVTNVDDRED